MRLQYYFEYLIVYVLKKDLALTKRTVIWDRTIELIKKNYIFGYGRENYSFRARKLGLSENSPGGLHAHDRFLETQYSGGIILSAIFIWILLYTEKIV